MKVQIDLKGSKFQLKKTSQDKQQQQYPFRFAIITAGNEKHLFSVNSQEELNRWLCAVKINGGLDEDYANKDRAAR